MISYKVDTVILNSINVDVLCPNKMQTKKKLKISKEIASDYVDDENIFASFPKVVVEISSTEDEPLLKCELSYFIALSFTEDLNKDECSNFLEERIMEMMIIQFHNDVNLILSKAKYPEVDISRFIE